MSDQITFADLSGKPASKEEFVYRQMLPAFSAELEKAFIPENELTFEVRKGYCSVMLNDTTLICRIKDSSKMGVLVTFRALKQDQMALLDGIEQNTPKSDRESGYCRIVLPEGRVTEQIQNLMGTVLANRTAKTSKSFDCCSRFEACSDAKKCIHPDAAFASNCGYRQKLQQGIIFYGKNRTIK